MAQWKRAGLITRRSPDRNGVKPLIFACLFFFLVDRLMKFLLFVGNLRVFASGSDFRILLSLFSTLVTDSLPLAGVI